MAEHEINTRSFWSETRTVFPGTLPIPLCLKVTVPTEFTQDTQKDNCGAACSVAKVFCGGGGGCPGSPSGTGQSPGNHSVQAMFAEGQQKATFILFGGSGGQLLICFDYLCSIKSPLFIYLFLRQDLAILSRLTLTL
jgi:hypothetical protein